MSTEITSEYLCDTDIWVKVCLAEKMNDFFSFYTKTAFADFVENEILKWNSNSNRFVKIAKHYQTFESNYNVIRFSKLDELTKQLIVKDFKQYFGVEDMDNSNKAVPNLGEQGSLLYAYHLEIPYIQSNDSSFFNDPKIQEHFNDIDVLTWYDVVNEITQNDNERIKLTALIEREQLEMKKSKEVHLKEKEATMEERLIQLKEKFS